jgi:hypothetical protein
MTTLTNAKHEAVALTYIADPEKVGWRAYRKVYPKSSRHAAENGFSRLMKNDEFSARVAELGTAAAQGKVLAVRQVLEEISRIATTDESSGIRLRALELLGKHYALFTERRVHEVSDAARLIAALARADERANDNVRPDRRRRARKPARADGPAGDARTQARWAR